MVSTTTTPPADEFVRVVVQARPLLPAERAGSLRSVLRLRADAVHLLRRDNGGVQQNLGISNDSFDNNNNMHADGMHADEDATADVYAPFDEVLDAHPDAAAHLYHSHVRTIVDSLFDGVNASVMAYGQTASGKTYTMSAMSQRVADQIFAIAKERASAKNVTIRVGFVEIYQEQIRDLTDAHATDTKRKNKRGNDASHAARTTGHRRPRGGEHAENTSPSSSTNVTITVRTRKNGVVFLDGARELPVRNAHQLMSIIHAGAQLRQTASTSMNAMSSRSHSIVTITVQQEPFEAAPSNISPSVAKSAPGGYLTAKLHLVDLAGSERTKRCTSAGGARFAEGVSINSGLLALAKVISALADRSSHVPYRESKLTRLLQDSLGGNSRSLVIACVSPSSASREETASTLRYAMRVKDIRNQPRVNVDPAAVETSDLRAALARARAQIVRLTRENDRLRHGTTCRAQDTEPSPIPCASPPSSPVIGALSSDLEPKLPRLDHGFKTTSPHERVGRRNSLPSDSTLGEGIQTTSPITARCQDSSSKDVEVGSLMLRLAELETLLHDSRVGPGPNAPLSSTLSVSPRAGRVDRQLEPYFATSSSHAFRDGNIGEQSTASMQPVAERESKFKTAFARKLATVEQEKADAERECAAVKEKLANIERGHEAEIQSITSEHQACIAELRLSLSEAHRGVGKMSAINQSHSSGRHSKNIHRGVDKTNNEGPPASKIMPVTLNAGVKVGHSARMTDVERQRMQWRLKMSERALADANSKLNDAISRADVKSSLVRDHHNLAKQEKSLRMQLQRSEAIRTRQMEQIQELMKDKVAARDRQRTIRTKQQIFNGDPGLASTQSGGGTLTPRQRQQWLEREVVAVVSRKDRAQENSEDSDQYQARHWAWIRSLDDAKAVLRMCVSAIVEARSGLVLAADNCAPMEMPLSRSTSLKESENELRPLRHKSSPRIARRSNSNALDGVDMSESSSPFQSFAASPLESRVSTLSRSQTLKSCKAEHAG
jgi:Kinesin motor domain